GGSGEREEGGGGGARGAERGGGLRGEGRGRPPPGELENTASSTATAISQAAISPTPAAYAAPLILAMVGFGSSLSVRSIALIVFALARFSASPPVAMRRIQPRSAPAETAPPRPVRTTIRVSPSAPSVLNASVSEWMTLSSIALRTCGRLSATVATPCASLVTRTQASLISDVSAIGAFQRRELSDCTISRSPQTAMRPRGRSVRAKSALRPEPYGLRVLCVLIPAAPWFAASAQAPSINRTEFHSPRRVHGHSERQPQVARLEQRRCPVRGRPSLLETPRTRKART